MEKGGKGFERRRAENLEIGVLLGWNGRVVLARNFD